MERVGNNVIRTRDEGDEFFRPSIANNVMAFSNLQPSVAAQSDKIEIFITWRFYRPKIERGCPSLPVGNKGRKAYRGETLQWERIVLYPQGW